MNKKIIIIGAGPGGLAAGMILASKGYQVKIYEKEDKVGGRNGFIKLGDFTFDIGPTFFMMKDALANIFRLSGKKMEDYFEVMPLDPMYRLVFKNNRTLYPSTDREKMKKELERFSPGSSAGYELYLEKEKKKHDKLLPCLSMPYQHYTDFLSYQFLSSLPYLDAHISLYAVLGRYFKDPDVKTAFTFQAKYIGMSPWEAPGTFSIISYIEHGGGIYHIKGGLNQLSQGMARAFKESGGEIELSRPVKEIIIEDRVVKGVVLEDGSKDFADYTIINADFAHAMTHLIDPKKLRKYRKPRLDQKKYSCSTFMLYLGVKKEYSNIAHHSIIFAEDYKANVDDITRTKKLSEDISFYVQNACVSDDSLAPKGKSTLYVLIPVPNNKSAIDWDQEKAALREKFLDLMETRGGYTDLRENIEEEYLITPKDWEEERSVYKGATFNLAHNIGQMLIFRPHNEFEDYRNCYLVGGGTHPGSGLPTIYESGRISSELIMKKDGIV